MPETELTVVVRAREFATRVFRQVGRSLRTLQRIGVRSFQALRRQVSGLRLLLAGGLLGALVTTTAGFETGIARVSTLVDEARVDMAALAEGVKEIGRASGDSFESLNQALFDTISAGVDAQKAIGFLGEASELAIGGVTSTASAVKGIVSIVNAYNLSVSEARNVSDALFQAQKAGITTVALLSENIGVLAPVARQAGLSVDEMLAAVASLTQGGLSTAEAITALRSALATLLKPTEDSKKAAQELGISWDLATLRAGGLVAFIKQLADVQATEAQQAALANGNIRAFVGLAGLARDGAGQLASVVESMGDKFGSAAEAAQKIGRTVAFQFAQLRREFQTLGIELGEALRPLTLEIIGDLKTFAERIRDNQVEIAAFADAGLRALKRLGDFLLTLAEGAVKLIAAVFSSNNPFETLIQLGITAIRSLADVFVASIPLVTEAGRQVGTAIANSVIREFVAETQVGLAKKITDGSVLGTFLGDLTTGFDSKRLGDIRKELETLSDLQADLADPSRKLEGRTLIGEGLADRIAIINRQIEESQNRLGNLLGGDFGGPAQVFTANPATLGAEATKFVDAAGQAIINATKSSALPAEVRQAITGIGGGDSVSKVVEDIRVLFGAANQTIEEEKRKAIGTEGLGFFAGVAEGTLAPFRSIANAAEGLGRNVGAAFARGTNETLTSSASATRELLSSLFVLDTSSSEFAQITEAIRLLRVQGADRAAEEVRILQEQEVAFFRQALEEKKISLVQFLEFRKLSEEELQRQLKEIYENEARESQNILITIQEVQNILASGFTQFINSLIDGSKKAGEALRDLGRFILQAFTSAAISSTFSSIFSVDAKAKGGVFPGSFQAFAQGSPRVDRPTLGLVGEGSRPEAVIPLPDGRNVPVRLSGAGTGGALTVIMNNTIHAMDGADVRRVLAREADTITGIHERALRSNAIFANRVRSVVNR